MQSIGSNAASNVYHCVRCGKVTTDTLIPACCCWSYLQTITHQVHLLGSGNSHIGDSDHEEMQRQLPLLVAIAYSVNLSLSSCSDDTKYLKKYGASF